MEYDSSMTTNTDAPFVRFCDMVAGDIIEITPTVWRIVGSVRILPPCKTVVLVTEEGERYMFHSTASKRCTVRTWSKRDMAMVL